MKHLEQSKFGRSFIIFVFFYFSSLWAATPQDILNKSAQSFQSANSWSLQFKAESALPGEASKSSLSGKLIIGKGDQFRLEMPGQQIISDGVTLWQYTPSRDQVMIRNAADQKEAMHPSEALFRYLRCKPISMQQVKEQKEDLYYLVLDPKGQVKGYVNMEVWLKTTDHTLVKLVTTDKTGLKNTYTISNLTRNAKISAETFRFKAPKDKADIEEIDMR